MRRTISLAMNVAIVAGGCGGGTTKTVKGAAFPLNADEARLADEYEGGSPQGGDEWCTYWEQKSDAAEAKLGGLRNWAAAKRNEACALRSGAPRGMVALPGPEKAEGWETSYEPSASGETRVVLLVDPLEGGLMPPGEPSFQRKKFHSSCLVANWERTPKGYRCTGIEEPGEGDGREIVTLSKWVPAERDLPEMTRERTIPAFFRRGVTTIIKLHSTFFSATAEERAKADVKTLARNLKQPFGIAVDAANVYWTEMEGGRVMLVPKSGGEPVELVAGFVKPTGIALDTENVYYTLQDPENGNVKSVAKAGSKSGFAFIARGQVSPTSVWVDDAVVIWGFGSGEREDGGVSIFTKADKKTKTVVKNKNRVFEVAADASSIFWTDQRTRDVWRSARSGTGARVLAKEAACPAMTHDATSLYFACDGEVRAVSKKDGAKTTLAKVEKKFLRGVAVDNAYVYFGAMDPPKGDKRTASDRGAILRVPKAGGEPQPVTKGNAVTVINIAVDDSHIYWTSDVAGAVMSVKK